ncbi:hypothetical protein HHK36_015221 [Tetracentron sinense]|uniref:pyruvate dehydrogenase (acetyl-transferring) n=1 Tax=Tetracentron sinense TaxID=13715 RepID=A0A834Z5R1_TETSI|nr:hypothetical protein HHK36_015221 [Tetracentron sinense]
MALNQIASSSSRSNLLKPLITLFRPFSSSPADNTILTVETSVPFTGHNCDPPSRTVETTPTELLGFFKDMALMRRMEIAADSLYKSKLIRGFCHLYDGQEAVAVGMEAAITKKDCIITAYRDHCIYLGRGGTLVEAFSELMGRKGGCSKGKGGSMHFYKKDGGFYGGHGIVGAQVPLGCGLAFAQKYSKDGTVTFALYGDGAANQGQLFEALNMAALWDLPAILVCENNHYGMGTAEWRAAKSPAYYKRGDYVDGMDAFAVKQACKFAKEHALKNGPIVSTFIQLLFYYRLVSQSNAALERLHWNKQIRYRRQRILCSIGNMTAALSTPCSIIKFFGSFPFIILEMDTYRYHGHSMSDPGSTYRTRDEISGVRQERDPVERIRKLVLSHELATEKELKEIEKEIRKQVDEAIAQAKESPMPDPSELFTNVYVKGFGVEHVGDYGEFSIEIRLSGEKEGSEMPPLSTAEGWCGGRLGLEAYLLGFEGMDFSQILSYTEGNESFNQEAETSRPKLCFGISGLNMKPYTKIKVGYAYNRGPVPHFDPMRPLA